MRTRLVEIRDLILDNLPEGTGSFYNFNYVIKCSIKFSDQIHNIDLDLFRSWSVKLKDKDEKKLTHEGEDEMLLLAERLQNRFPKILSNIYSDTSYKVSKKKTTKKHEYLSLVQIHSDSKN